MEATKHKEELKPYVYVLIFFSVLLIIAVAYFIRDYFKEKQADTEAQQAMSNTSDTLRFQDKYTGDDKEAFLSKVFYYADKLGVDPNNLMGVMYFESRLNPAIQNSIGATGLIQFMPSTATSLGTNTDDLAAMSGSDQMDYVYKYLNQYSNYDNPIDLYLAIFFPAAMGQDSDWTIQTKSLSPALIAKQNPIFDPQKKGYVTVQDVQDALNSYIS